MRGRGRRGDDGRRHRRVTGRQEPRGLPNEARPTCATGCSRPSASTRPTSSSRSTGLTRSARRDGATRTTSWPSPSAPSRSSAAATSSSPGSIAWRASGKTFAPPLTTSMPLCQRRCRPAANLRGPRVRDRGTATAARSPRWSTGHWTARGRTPRDARPGAPVSRAMESDHDVGAGPTAERTRRAYAGAMEALELARGVGRRWPGGVGVGVGGPEPAMLDERDRAAPTTRRRWNSPGLAAMTRWSPPRCLLIGWHYGSPTSLGDRRRCFESRGARARGAEEPPVLESMALFGICHESRRRNTRGREKSAGRP